MSAVAIAVGVAGAAISAGVQAGTAKSAAKKQGKAADKASQISQDATDKANELARQQYEEDLRRQQDQLNIATGRLDPYASVGGNALQQLGQLTSSPHGEQTYTVESGTNPQMAGQIRDWQAKAIQAAQDNTRFIQEAQARGDTAEVQRLQGQDAVLQENARKAQATPISPYSTRQETRAANPYGGELYREFNQNDYLNDPTSGANFNPADFRQSSTTGGKLSDAEINQWLRDHPQANDSQIAQAMRQYGVSTQQLAKATGMDENVINQRLMSARDPNATSAAPNLNKNFDETGWLKERGIPKNALTQNFDRAGYLKSAGFAEADLARKFTQKDFVTDPGYQFRLEQGNKGIEGSRAAVGGQLSGATLKALARYNQDFGSNEYGNVFDRFQRTQRQAGDALGGAENSYNANRQNLSNEFTGAFNRFGSNRENARTNYTDAYNRWTQGRSDRFNRLAQLAGIGERSSTNQAGMNMDYARGTSAASQNYSQRVGNNYIGNGQTQGENAMQKGNAQAAGQIATGNAISSGIGAATNGYSQYTASRGAEGQFNKLYDQQERYNNNLVTSLRR